MTTFSVAAACAHAAATTRAQHVEARRRAAVNEASRHIREGHPGRAFFTLMRPLAHLAELSDADVDPVQATVMFEACLSRHIDAYALRALARERRRG